MATFYRIERTGKNEEEYVAILRHTHGEDFRINARNLKARIKNLTRANHNTKEEKAALSALEGVSE